MKKADISREYSMWETLDRDILALIFGKLEPKDLYKGASRVCISWFLASHNKTLWNTIDLDKLHQVGECISLWSLFTRISKLFLFDCCGVRTNFSRKDPKNFFFLIDCCGVQTIITNITKFSRTAPRNLSFSYTSCVGEDDLIFAAERMQNIEKLFLPQWCYRNKNSFQNAFSKWKNLKTLIIADVYFQTVTFEFQVLGENCTNLTNLKYYGYFGTHGADQIVLHLQNLKRLSLRCSYYNPNGVLSLITGLQNLAVLNLSHCRTLDLVPMDNFLQAATQKIEKVITCSQDCRFCKRNRNLLWSKYWRNDEIHELEF